MLDRLRLPLQPKTIASKWTRGSNCCCRKPLPSSPAEDQMAETCGRGPRLSPLLRWWLAVTMACLGDGRGGNGVSPLILIVMTRENRSVSVFRQKIQSLAGLSRRDVTTVGNILKHDVTIVEKAGGGGGEEEKGYGRKRSPPSVRGPLVFPLFFRSSIFEFPTRKKRGGGDPPDPLSGQYWTSKRRQLP